jgi:hypothetical protein
MRSEARLTKMEDAILAMLCTKALRLARLQPREHFAQCYLDAVPPGPAPGQVQVDLEALTVQELWALARHGDPSLPDIEGMTPGQLRQLAMEQA